MLNDYETTPRVRAERLQRCFAAMAPVTGVPQVALAQLAMITAEDSAEWLERVAHFMRFSRQTKATKRLVDVWAAYYLAGHLSFDEYAQSPSTLLGPWQPLTQTALDDDERSTLLELGEENQWSNRQDILGMVL